jgi:hypothetical protein
MRVVLEAARILNFNLVACAPLPVVLVVIPASVGLEQLPERMECDRT